MSDKRLSVETLIAQWRTQLEGVAKMIACAHDNRTGGNDYHLCNDCDLMWDYRREGPKDGLIRYLHERLRACADELAAHLHQKKAHDDDLTRGGTPEMREGFQSSASQNEVISAPAPNKDVGAYIAAMADGDCFGADPEHECRDVFSVDQWCKSCLAVEIIEWHHAEMQRLFNAAATPPGVSAPPAQAPTDDEEKALSRLPAVTLSEGQDPRVHRNEVD